MRDEALIEAAESSVVQISSLPKPTKRTKGRRGKCLFPPPPMPKIHVQPEAVKISTPSSSNARSSLLTEELQLATESIQASKGLGATITPFEPRVDGRTAEIYGIPVSAVENAGGRVEARQVEAMSYELASQWLRSIRRRKEVRRSSASLRRKARTLKRCRDRYLLEPEMKTMEQRMAPFIVRTPQRLKRRRSPEGVCEWIKRLQQDLFGNAKSTNPIARPRSDPCISESTSTGEKRLSHSSLPRNFVAASTADEDIGTPRRFVNSETVILDTISSPTPVGCTNGRAVGAMKKDYPAKVNGHYRRFSFRTCMRKFEVETPSREPVSNRWLSAVKAQDKKVVTRPFKPGVSIAVKVRNFERKCARTQLRHDIAFGTREGELRQIDPALLSLAPTPPRRRTSVGSVASRFHRRRSSTGADDMHGIRRGRVRDLVKKFQSGSIAKPSSTQALINRFETLKAQTSTESDGISTGRVAALREKFENGGARKFG